MNFFLNYYHIYLFIFGLLIIFNLSYQSNSISLKFPKSLTLLDYSFAVVAQDGIHFYDTLFESEIPNKNISFTLSSASDLDKVSMAQFSNEYGGYILIIVINQLYIFDNDKNNIGIKSLDGIISGSHYCIIPYKKYDNILKFIISFAETNLKNIVLANSTFNILNSNLEIIQKNIQALNSEGVLAGQLEGVYCLLLSPLSTLNINNDLLTCFGGIHSTSNIFSRTFDPENDFDEIVELKSFERNEIMDYCISYIEAKTNNNKKKYFSILYLLRNLCGQHLIILINFQ